MKKWNMMLLALTLLALPVTGAAQDLPDFLSAVYTGFEEGIEEGAAQALAAMDQELTLEVLPSAGRIEEGQTVVLAVRAGNPRPQEAKVSITLDLPKRLTAQPDTGWEAVLPQAQYDPQTGTLVPSQTVFTREITLAHGGISEQAQIVAEMSMGTRFYRTQADVALCVPDVKVTADVTGTRENRVQPGDAFAYQLEITNAGAAAKDVSIELALPEGAASSGQLPTGFAREDGVIRGHVHAAQAGDAPSRVVLDFPVTAQGDLLEDEADARRLLKGALSVDGKRAALPRVEVCGAKISASLLPDKENLEEGEAATLSVVVVNAGLAAADVKLSCVLPQGLKLRTEEEATPGEAVLPPKDGGHAGALIPAMTAQTIENRTVVFDLHMEAAKETEEGVIASTQVLEIPVTAEAPQDELSEELLGASLAWSVDEAPAQLGEAVVLRVHRSEFLGISKAEWNGLFWAGVLLLAAVACLYAAARRSSAAEDLCCE